MNEKVIDLFNIDSIEVSVDTYWLFKKNMKDNYYNSSILIKMLAIDNYYNKNSFGFNWYNEMQLKRVNDNPMIPKYMAYHEDEFKTLIDNFEKCGFDKKYPIVLNKDFLIVDGTHRLALALYFNIKRIYIKIDQKSYCLESKDYSLEWFKNHDMGFVENELIKKYNMIESSWKN